MAAGEWRDVILLTLRETPSKPREGKEFKAGEGYGLWVVARVKPDGGLFNVTMRAGKYSPNKITGEKMLPKEGPGWYDFMELKKPGQGAATKWEEVMKLLDPKHPPALPKPEDAPAPPPTDDDTPPWLK